MKSVAPEVCSCHYLLALVEFHSTTEIQVPAKQKLYPSVKKETEWKEKDAAFTQYQVTCQMILLGENHFSATNLMLLWVQAVDQLPSRHLDQNLLEFFAPLNWTLNMVIFGYKITDGF